MHNLFSDFRHALRQLRRSPGFTLAALITLGLGIGANTALFSVINAVLIRPLPFPQPGELVRVYSTVRGQNASVSPADFLDWKTLSHSYAGLAAMNGGSMALSGEGTAEQLPMAQVSDGFFRIVGVEPAIGHAFSGEENTPGGDHVVLLGDPVWRRRFGADPNIVGRTIRLDGSPWLVAGVMPAGFAYPDEPQIWTPLTFDPQTAAMRGGHYLDIVGRLKPGVTIDAAARDMASIAARIRGDHPDVNIEWGATAISLRDATVGDVRPALLVLLGAVGFVLLIACVNVANLLLARGTARVREHAVRAALGASASRLASGVMAESLWLGVGGSVLGVALAAWGTDAAIAMAPANVPGISGAKMEPAVLLFALLAGVFTSLLFGLLPAWRVSRAWALADRLREGGASLGGLHGRRSRQGLVATEVALAVVLVVGAGLLLKSFNRLRSVDPGFDPNGVLTFDVSLPDATTPARSAVFYASLMERMAALPGVQSSAAIFGLPLRDFGYGITLHSLDGRDLSNQEQENGVVPQVRVVTRDYFRTLGIRTLKGRTFTTADRDSTVPVAVLSETAARRMFPGQDALGHDFTLGTRLGLGPTHARVGGEVIGVVQDVRDVSLARTGRPWVYVVHDQFPVNYLSVVLRTAGSPASLINSARNALAQLDADTPMYHTRTMGEWISASMAANRFYAMLTGIFAALAIGLAAVGVYGVLAQAVGERTREIGLRMALGASPSQVTGQVVRQGIAPAALGLGVGLVLALGLTQLLRKWLTPMLFSVGPADISTYLVVALVMSVVALLAALLPARRAARVDPLVALRAD